MTMNLYLISLNGDNAYVEAPTMQEAIAAWRAWWVDQLGDEGDEPDQCALVHNEPVVRAKSQAAANRVGEALGAEFGVKEP